MVGVFVAHPEKHLRQAVLEHVAYLWGFTVRLEGEDSEGKVSLIAERMREKRSGHAADP